MKTLKRCYPLLLSVLLLAIACDNPVQTEQKLDEWENYVHSAALGKMSHLTSSPDGKYFAFTRERELTFVTESDLTWEQRDTLAIMYNIADFYETPVFSHDASKLAYVKDDYLRIYDIASGIEEKILYVNYYPRNLTWSRDDQSIYYCDRGSSDYQIKSAEISSQQITAYDHPELVSTSQWVLTVNEQYIIQPNHKSIFNGEHYENKSWIEQLALNGSNHAIIVDTTFSSLFSLTQSPDGTLLAYFARDTSGIYSTNIVNLNTLQLVLQDTMIFPDTQPIWSHDNNTLFIDGRIEENGSYTSGIWSLDVTTGNKTLLTSSGSLSNITLHPLKDKYIRFYSDTYYNVATVTTQDSQITDISPFYFQNNFYPVWSPQSSRVYYNWRGALHYSSPDGGESGRYIDNSFLNGDISPDGKYLASGSGTSSAYVYDLEQQTLISNLSPAQDPSWSPDGQQLVCFYEDNVYIYRKEGDYFIPIYAAYVPFVKAVEWSPIASASEYEILCTTFDPASEYSQIILLNSQLDKQWELGDYYYSKVTACWMANGIEMAYNVDRIYTNTSMYDGKIFIRRITSEF